MGRRGRVGVLVSCLAALSGFPAAGYYHFVHYTTSGPIQEKFDLRVLPNKTVTFYVSDAGLSNTIFGGTDSFGSALAQIRQATMAWNAVDTSDLRVAFGGLETTGTPQATPGVDIVFEDMVPGVLAYTGHTSLNSTAAGPNGPFVPIARSLVHLSRDFTKRPGPSYSELFYTTVVHEMGHALGLQHTFTGAAMSTYVTRATSRANPVERDDIAGISLLYPKGNFVSQFGSITGRVTSGGQGVHMASVVALRPSGAAVSALTNPDGSYRIDGLPPGQYWVYEHPLPPDANITPPVDASGNPVQPSGPTETLFWAGQGNPGTRDPKQFATISIAAAGQVVSGIDFSAQPAASVAIYDVSTYSYFGAAQNPVSPAYLNATLATGTVAAQGTGLTTSGGAVTPGLNVQLLGGFAPMPFLAYGSPAALAMYVSFPVSAGSGPRHLLFTLPNDAYVLPSAVLLTTKDPPSISAVTANPDGSVTLAGTSLAADSRIFFDGQPATITVPFAGNDQSGSITVQPPPGVAGQVSTITAYNSDGQNSMFLQQQSPATYTYPPTTPFSGAATSGVIVNPASLPAGATSMVDVVSTGGLRFVDGQTSLGFGSTDLYVRHVWVMSPTHAVANVKVAANAPSGTSEASVVSGFQTYTQPSAFQTLPANPQMPTLALPLVNANANQTTTYPGAVVSLFGANLAISPSSVALTLNGQAIQPLFASATQINFQIPTNISIGPAILNLNNGAASAFPVVIQIDSAPPTIVAVTSSANALLDTLHAALRGDTLQVIVTGIDPAVLGAPTRVHVTLNGVDVPATAVLPVGGQTALLAVQFVLPQSTAGQQATLSISVDGNASIPVVISLRGGS